MLITYVTSVTSQTHQHHSHHTLTLWPLISLFLTLAVTLLIMSHFATPTSHKITGVPEQPGVQGQVHQNHPGTAAEPQQCCGVRVRSHPHKAQPGANSHPGCSKLLLPGACWSSTIVAVTRGCVWCGRRGEGGASASWAHAAELSTVAGDHVPNLAHEAQQLASQGPVHVHL